MEQDEIRINKQDEIRINKQEEIRINKYLSQAGVLSRRKADEAIERGEVLINGVTAVAGDKVKPGDEVSYKGRVVGAEEAEKERVILAYNKPLGLVCTSKDADKDSIFRKIDYPDMLFYVGRLDKNSQGLILLTNDGELANQIQKARNNHEKEYVVRVDKPLTAEFVKGMMNGVPLEIEPKFGAFSGRGTDEPRVDGQNSSNKKLSTVEQNGADKKIRVTKRCEVKQTGKNTFRIILTEGINRQIRRMCEHFGYRVTFLKRVRVMNIPLGNLPVGEYRKISKNEEAKLRETIKSH